MNRSLRQKRAKKTRPIPAERGGGAIQVKRASSRPSRSGRPDVVISTDSDFCQWSALDLLDKVNQAVASGFGVYALFLDDQRNYNHLNSLVQQLEDQGVRFPIPVHIVRA